MSEQRTTSETIDYILSVLTTLEHEGIAVEPIHFADSMDTKAHQDHDYAIRVVMPTEELDPKTNTTACMVVRTSINISQLQQLNDEAFGKSLANLMKGILDSLGEREAIDTTGVTVHHAPPDTLIKH